MNVDLSAWGPEPPLFVRLLAAEVAISDKTRAGKRIKMSRSAVSLILANRYASPSTGGVERRVMKALGDIKCVVLEEVVTSEQCQSYRTKPAPTHNPQAMQIWRACKHCKHNPDYCQQEIEHDRLHKPCAAKSVDAKTCRTPASVQSDSQNVAIDAHSVTENRPAPEPADHRP